MPANFPPVSPSARHILHRSHRRQAVDVFAVATRRQAVDDFTVATRRQAVVLQSFSTSDSMVVFTVAIRRQAVERWRIVERWASTIWRR